MPQTTFARRRRKVRMLRQNINNLYPILNPMNSLLLKLVATNAGWLVRNLLKASVVASASITTWLLAKGIDAHWATAIGTAGAGLILWLAETTLSWVARKYSVGEDLQPILDGLKGAAAKTVRIVPVFVICLLLTSCQNGQFMGLDSKGWTNVLVDGGKTLGKQAPSAFLQAYAAEQNRPKTSAKQPIDVQPVVITPEPAPSPTQSFLTRWF